MVTLQYRAAAWLSLECVRASCTDGWREPQTGMHLTVSLWRQFDDSVQRTFNVWELICRDGEARHAVPLHNGEQRRKNFVCYLSFITTQLEAYHWSCLGSRPRCTSSRPGDRGTRGGHHQVHTLTYVRMSRLHQDPTVGTYVYVRMYVRTCVRVVSIATLPRVWSTTLTWWHITKMFFCLSSSCVEQHTDTQTNMSCYSLSTDWLGLR